ncbi:MAG: 50S ribosomal protein L18 [Clostridia bacterium]|nr:50S ribosomal protein L18 [Clostridia bacterium]
MIKKIHRNKDRKIRHARNRKKISGTSERPRFNVFKSLNHVYAQIINDETGETLVSASTLETEIKQKANSNCNIEAAKMVGSRIAEKALEKGINKVVFDRGGYIYHGKVKALADAAREKGLDF